MQLGAILTFHDDGARPHSEVVLRNGDRARIVLNGGGVTIVELVGGTEPKILFEATPDIAAHICAGLVESQSATPLRILTLAIIQIGSASEVRAAFEAAAAQVR